MLQRREQHAELPMRAQIPSLTIQPLLENAIYHGIELLPEGGEVHVTGKRDDRFLDITISNPVARGEKRSKEGNQMALANIRQRFELAYGTRATVDVEADGSNYAVRLRFRPPPRAEEPQTDAAGRAMPQTILRRSRLGNQCVNRNRWAFIGQSAKIVVSRVALKRMSGQRSSVSWRLTRVGAR